MTELHQRLGLLHCGIDFAVGTVGGVFGDTVMAAVQDINPKVTGALFLREFMARHPEIGVGAATRVLSPEATESAESIRSLVSEFSHGRTALRGGRRRARPVGDDRHCGADVGVGRSASVDPGADACHVAMT